MSRRVLIAVGGTGGHLYPAQALACQLRQLASDVEVMFVGGGLKGNRFFDEGSFLYQDISSATLSKGGLLTRVSGAQAIVKGILQCRRIIKAFNPHVVVGFGSYHTLPALMAARLAGVPLVLHEANSMPGKVNNHFSQYAQVTGIHFPETADRLRGRSIEVGMPLREGYTLAFGSKEKARQAFGLEPDRFTFLVFGGSQGALAINALFCSAMAHEFAERTTNFQVIHLTGEQGMVEEIQEEYENFRVNACVKGFEERMDLAWLAADLAVTRSGASTIAEMLEFEVPAILIPYPYATDNHQEMNADFVSNVVGGSVTLLEDSLEAEGLSKVIRDMVKSDRQQLKKMQRALQKYKQQHKTRDLCSLVCEVGGIRS